MASVNGQKSLWKLGHLIYISYHFTNRLYLISRTMVSCGEIYGKDKINANWKLVDKNHKLLTSSVLANILDWQISWRVAKLGPYVWEFQGDDCWEKWTCLDWVLELVNIRITVKSSRSTDTCFSIPVTGTTAFSCEAHVTTPWHLNLLQIFLFFDQTESPTLPSDVKKYFLYYLFELTCL